MNLSTWSNTIKTLKGVCSGIVFLAKHFQLKLQYSIKVLAIYSNNHMNIKGSVLWICLLGLTLQFKH